MSPTSESEFGAAAGEPSVELASAASGIDDPNAVYALGSSSGESARLKRQAEELLPLIARCSLTGLACGPATARSILVADPAGSSICWPSG